VGGRINTFTKAIYTVSIISTFRKSCQKRLLAGFFSLSFIFLIPTIIETYSKTTPS
jgi:hypothetical protein